MKLGTQLILPDGREATAVYNGLEGVGCKLGLHKTDPKDFEGTSGGLLDDEIPEDFKWEPDVLLRKPWKTCENIGWEADQCVGDECDCKIIRQGGNDE